MSPKLAKGQEPISYQALLDENRALQGEIQSLKTRLEEAEELKRAISEGDLDALIINGPEGELIFTLDSADRAYRVLVETMNEGTVTLACDGIILYSNRQFANFLKISPQEVVGKPIYPFIAPESAATFKALLEHEAGMGEINLLAEGGTILPVYLSISSLKNEGSPNAWCLVVTDLTEQKRSEEIIAAERLARSIIEQAAEAIIVCDTSGKIIRFSNATFRICGHDPIFKRFEDIVDLRFSEGINAGESIHPVSSALKGSSVLGVETIFEKNCYKMHLLLNSGPLKNADGKIIGCVVTLTDITERKQIEEALRESEEKYRNIIETANEGVWIVDPDAITAYVNQKMAQMLGCTQEEMIGKSARDFTDEEGRAISIHNMKKREQGVNESHEFKLIRKDGSPVWTLISDKSLFDKNGKFVGSMSMLTDITGRKKAETELQKTLEDLESLVKERTVELEKAYESLKESEAGLAEAQKMAHLGNWDRDIQTGEIYWSDEVYRIFGYNPQEFRATYDSFLNYVHPDDQDYVKRSIEETLNGKPYDISYRILSTDGTERIVHSKGEITFDKEGSPVRMKGIIQDVTGYKQMETALERVARLSQENPDPVLRLSQDRRINYSNTAARTLLTEWGSAFNQEVPEEIAELAVASLNDGFRRELECTYANHTYLINIAPFPDYVNLYAHDITERKKAQQDLEEMERIRIKEIHHRIKNNLQVISSLISLEAEKFNDTKILEAFKESQHRVASMALIHEELYKGSKADSLDFGAYLQKLTAELFTSYNVGNDNISLKLDLEQVYLDMDTAIPLGIIVNELISNSLKHAFSAGSKGEICVSLCRTENLAAKHYLSTQNLDCAENNSLQYTLIVMDNGKGIPEEIELESSNSLGLQLVNILVEQIDGCIELRRNSGTKFFIWFGNSER